MVWPCTLWPTPPSSPSEYYGAVHTSILQVFFDITTLDCKMSEQELAQTLISKAGFETINAFGAS